MAVPRTTRLLLASAAAALIVISSVWWAGPMTVEARRSKCSAARDAEFDELAAHLGFLGDRSFRVPQNMTRMGEFCSQLKDSVGGIQSYARSCLQGFSRQILGTLMRRGKQQQSAICQTDANRREFMQKLACLRDTSKVLAFHRCMDASVTRYEFIASEEVANELKLPALCCSYQIFVQAVDTTLARLCGRKDGEATKFIQRLLTGTTGEFFQLVCEDHRSMEECRTSAKTRDTLKQLQEMTNKVGEGKLGPRGKSLIPPLLEILDASG